MYISDYENRISKSSALSADLNHNDNESTAKNYGGVTLLYHGKYGKYCSEQNWSDAFWSPYRITTVPYHYL